MNILLVSYSNPLGQGGLEKQTLGVVKTLINKGHSYGCLTVSTSINHKILQSQIEKTNCFKLGCFLVCHEAKPYTKLTKAHFWFNTNPARFLAQQFPRFLEEFQQKLEQICQELAIDIIHVQGLRTSYYLPEKLSTPTILDLIDSISLRNKIFFQQQVKSNLLSSIPAWLNYFKAVRLETSILNTYLNSCTVVTISTLDAKVFKRISPSSDVQTISPAISLDIVKQPNLEPKKKLSFYGFIKEHNLDALLFLILEIMPLVIKVHPDTKLAVTGFDLPDIIFNLSEKFEWIELTPKVENISTFIATSRLVCFPFRYGSGVKTKIIEVMALGKPVVTTMRGVAGLKDNQTEGILIADTAKKLAFQVNYLLSNPDECLRLGRINQEIAIQEFTWEKRAQEYLKLYQSVVEKRQFNQ